MNLTDDEKLALARLQKERARLTASLLETFAMESTEPDEKSALDWTIAQPAKKVSPDQPVCQ